MTTGKRVEYYLFTTLSSSLLAVSPFLFGMSGQGRGAALFVIAVILAGLTLVFRSRKQVRKFIDDLPGAEKSLAKEMKKHFTMSKCPGCGETTYAFKQFNDNFTALQLECEECSEVIWLESRCQESSDLERFFLRYKELVSHLRMAQPERDIVTNWQYQLDQESINE